MSASVCTTAAWRGMPAFGPRPSCTAISTKIRTASSWCLKICATYEVQVAGVAAGRARLAVREIAKLHGQFWDAVDHPALSGCTDVLGPRFRRFMQTACLLCLPVVLERFGDSFSRETRRLAEALGPRITAHFAAVAAGPRTFVHGDWIPLDALLPDRRFDLDTRLRREYCAVKTDIRTSLGNGSRRAGGTSK